MAPRIKLLIFLLPALLAGGGIAAAQSPGQDVVAVLSSESGPYREASAGLQEGLGATPQTFVLSREEPDIPPATRVVVAFGSKAALRGYPDGVTLIYALAPAADVPDPAVEVCMTLEASQLLANMRKVHPGLKRIGILWRSRQLAPYIEKLRQAGRNEGITIERAALGSNSDIPDQLRRLYGKIDAIWLPPDPLLLNADSLAIFTGFSRANAVPLFVPTGGLLEQGATAAVGASFREMGRLAGLAAQQALSGSVPESKIYPVKVEISVNKAVAAQIGLKIPEETLRNADRRLP